MGILDSNIVKTTQLTGLEKQPFFKKVCSTDAFDMFLWKSESNTRKYLRASFRDIFAWSDGSVSAEKIYLIKGKITDEPIEIAVNDTSFPNLRKDASDKFPKVERIIVCPCDFVYNGSTWENSTWREGSDSRVCVIFKNGQVYHNYPPLYDDHDFYNPTWAKNDGRSKISDYFDKFVEGAVWDLPNRKAPTKDNELVLTGAYYYNPALPNNNYEMHPPVNQPNGYGNTIGYGATINPSNQGIRPRFWRIDMDNENANSLSYMGGYIADCQFTMVGTYRTNKGNTPARTCIFATQDGGRNWYCMYEFGGHDTLILDDSLTPSNSEWVAYGVPLSLIGNASNGIYVAKRRNSYCPTATNKEPENKFRFDSPVAIASIVGTSTDIKINTAIKHGFSDGDCIVIDFADGVSANNRAFDWCVNSSADANSGGNGVLFRVKKTSDTQFVLTMNPYNPDNNLSVRHIHALNRCKDGVAVSCGESYPHGGWILYGAIKLADAGGAYSVVNANHTNWVRLNSTKMSFQRPLGVIVESEDIDGQPHTMVYVGVDNEYTTMTDVHLPSGRTDTFRHNSVGVWKCKIEDIDEQSAKGVVKLNAREVTYGFQKMGNALVFTGQFGMFAVSYDNGESWTIANIPVEKDGELSHWSGMTYDRMFSIDNVLIQLKK